MSMEDRVRSVGKAQQIPEQFSFESQQFLKRSHHPYAPFTGDAFEWDSWVYDDATTFEGTTRATTPHGKGVMTMGRVGRGAGFASTQLGDKYEGEFHTGYAHGTGMYTGADGLVYKGEFTLGQKDGCGAMYDLKPWRDLVASGVHPQKAWKQTKKAIHDSTTYGTWRNDNFVSEPSDIGAFCSLGDVQKTLHEVDNLVARARMFTFRPDGAATVHKMQLPSGAPAPVMQHPLHYPHGTLFMAPGPAGQTAAVPNEPSLRKLMLREFINYKHIHDRYNFDYVPASDSLMAKAMKLFNREEKIKKKEEELEKRRAERRLRKIQQESGADVSAASSRSDDGGDDNNGDGGDSGAFDDSDLLADAAMLMRAQPAQPGRVPLGTAFGSVTLSISRAQLGLHRFFENVSKRAAPMPRLGRRQA